MITKKIDLDLVSVAILPALAVSVTVILLGKPWDFPRRSPIVFRRS